MGAAQRALPSGVRERRLCPASAAQRALPSGVREIINMPYTYILKSLKDNKKYIGSTVNLSKRLRQHNDGRVFSTKYRRPLILYAYRKFKTIKEAAKFEKKYKKSYDLLNRDIKSGKFLTSGIGADG
jgi:putative endonuclease